MSSGYLKKKEDGTYGAQTTQATRDNISKLETGLTNLQYKENAKIGASLLDSINNGTLKDNPNASKFSGYGFGDDGHFWYDDGSGITHLNTDGSLKVKYDKGGEYVSGDKAYDNRQPTISYADSPAVQAAEQQISAAQSKGDKLSSIIDDYLGREKFSYDPEADTLFQQDLTNAMNMGQMAMQDTMGQAAALTGGYGSTYATSAANQAYNSMVENAYDNVADYYNMALSQYNLEDNRMLNAYNMLNEQDTKDWQKYVDDRNFNYQKEQDSKDWEWKESEAQREQGNIDRQFEENVRQFDAGVEQWEKSFEYQQLRDSIADSQWQAQFDEAVREWKKEMRFKVKQGKISQEQWQAEFDEKVREWEKEYGLSSAKFAASQSSGSGYGGSGVEASQQSNYKSKELNEIAQKATEIYNSQGEDAMLKYLEGQGGADSFMPFTDSEYNQILSYVSNLGSYDSYDAVASTQKQLNDYLSGFTYKAGTDGVGGRFIKGNSSYTADDMKYVYRQFIDGLRIPDSEKQNLYSQAESYLRRMAQTK